jgi:endonuclease/exonuclease/phosphatase (EEP) superfamily protein YafD
MLRVFKFVVWAIFVALGLLALLGTLSGWLSERFWVCEVATHFQVQYVVVLLLVSLGFALGGQRKTAALWGFIALVAFCYQILPLYIAHEPRPAGPRSIRLLSSNIAFFNRHHHPLIKLIKDDDPDVVLLYEVSSDWLEDLKPLEAIYEHFRIVPSPGHSGTALYSRLPVDEIHHVYVVGSPLMYTTVQIGDKHLTIIGAHPDSPNNTREMQRRNEQLDELVDLILSLPRPRVLIGDFNTSSWHPAFKRLLMETAMRDSRRGFGIQPSWPVDFPLFRTPIDHCLVSKGVGVVDRRLPRSIGSDHFPVLVDLVLADGEPSVDISSPN